MTETIGWIGLGNMGHRMVRHLMNAGHKLVVTDKMGLDKAPPGAEAVKTNAEVAAKSDLIFLSLPDGKISEIVVREIVAAPGRRAKMVIDTSTIGIKAAETLADILAKADMAFVDSPVSGGTAGAEKATVSVMVACPAATYERLLPLTKLIGKPFHIGPKAGQGQAVKLLNNYLSGTAMAASSEAIAFGVKQGIPMKTILDVVNVSTGRNTATDDKFPRRIINESYDAGFTNTLMAKDVRLYLENARAAGISDVIASVMSEVWSKMEADEPNADITRMYPYTRDGRTKK